MVTGSGSWNILQKGIFIAVLCRFEEFFIGGETVRSSKGKIHFSEPI
jgi:hypothetical protein